MSRLSAASSALCRNPGLPIAERPDLLLKRQRPGKPDPRARRGIDRHAGEEPEASEKAKGAVIA
jgi:hypothetical protein